MEYIDNTFGDNIDPEQAQKQRELGRIGAMLDGMVDEFVFRGFRVTRHGKTLRFMSEDGNILGGGLFGPQATVSGVHDWLVNKADHYGEGQ